MEMTTFGKTGLTVSRLGFGGAPIGFLETDRQQVQRVLGFLLDAGVNVIDTAACYAGSEEAIGEAVAHRRDEYVIVSKCGHAAGLETPDWAPETIRASIDRSLQRLKADHIDVMLLHSCGREVLEKGEALGAVKEAIEAGKVRVAGYSGDNETAAYAAGLDGIDALETSVSICDQRNIDVVLPVCRERNVGVIAKRPIANAAWRRVEDQKGMYKEYGSDYRARLSSMNVTPHDLGYHGHTEVEWPEIALKFTLAQPGVHTAICGTTSVTNAQVNVQAVQKNPLREQVVDRLRRAFREAEAASGETWRGLT